LTDGRSAGFEIVLDDGGTLAIPAGPIELRAPSTALPGRPRSVRRYLRRALGSACPWRRAPVPLDAAHEQLLGDGDRVRVSVTRSPEPESLADAPYRRPPPLRLHPRGAAIIELILPAAAAARRPG
jgi:hypothetical protein